MLPVVEIPGLTKAEAYQRAIDLGIDAPTIEIIQQPDGTFTVRSAGAETEVELRRRHPLRATWTGDGLRNPVKVVLVRV